MSYKLRQRSKDEGGFTLIELLVVILIIGILAAIALPSFINQKSKADDAAAKTQVGTGQTAMETVSTENSGSYEAVKAPAELETIEPSLKDHTEAKLTVAKGEGSTGYEITSESIATKDTYTLKNKGGEITRACTVAGKGDCPASGKW